MTISDATLGVDVFTTIRTALVDASIKITEDDGSKKSASVLPAYSNTKATLPQIIVESPSKDESEYKFGSNTGRQFISVTVTCFYTTAKGCEQLRDAVNNTISNLSLNEMQLVGVTFDNAFSDPNDGSYHEKSATFTFDKE